MCFECGRRRRRLPRTSISTDLGRHPPIPLTSQGSSGWRNPRGTSRISSSSSPTSTTRPFPREPPRVTRGEVHRQFGSLHLRAFLRGAPGVGGSSSRSVAAGDSSLKVYSPGRLASDRFSSIGSAIPKPLTGASGVHVDTCPAGQVPMCEGTLEEFPTRPGI